MLPLTSFVPLKISEASSEATEEVVVKLRGIGKFGGFGGFLNTLFSFAGLFFVFEEMEPERTNFGYFANDSVDVLPTESDIRRSSSTL